MKNKKGAILDHPSSIALLIVGIIFLIFLTSGGASTISNITKGLSSIPTPVWIIIIFFFLLLILGGRRK